MRYEMLAVHQPFIDALRRFNTCVHSKSSVDSGRRWGGGHSESCWGYVLENEKRVTNSFGSEMVFVKAGRTQRPN